MSPNEQARAWLKHIKTDDWWQSQMPISVIGIASCLGLDQDNFRKKLRNLNGYREYDALGKIASIIPEIERRAIVFPKRNTGFAVKKFGHKPKWLRLEPLEGKSLIDRLAPESGWSLWARCQRCGNNKFLPVEIDAKPHVACYHCLPPLQHRAIGATRVKKSLIHESLKKYY